MHAQQQIEINDVKKNGYQGQEEEVLRGTALVNALAGVPMLIMNAMPPSQQQMFQKVPGSSSTSGSAYPKAFIDLTRWTCTAMAACLLPWSERRSHSAPAASQLWGQGL